MTPPPISFGAHRPLVGLASPHIEEHCRYYCSHDEDDWHGLPAVVLGLLDRSATHDRKPLGYFRKIGFVLQVYNHKLHV
jgi:hypothetical protein